VLKRPFFVTCSPPRGIRQSHSSRWMSSFNLAGRCAENELGAWRAVAREQAIEEELAPSSLSAYATEGRLNEAVSRVSDTAAACIARRRRETGATSSKLLVTAKRAADSASSIRLWDYWLLGSRLRPHAISQVQVNLPRHSIANHRSTL